MTRALTEVATRRKVEDLAAKHKLDGPAFDGHETLEQLSERRTWLHLLRERFRVMPGRAGAALLYMVEQHIPPVEARISELRTTPQIRMSGNYSIGTVYVAGYGPYVKIGFTAGPVEARLAAIPTPLPFNIYGEFPNATRALERELHARFAHQRLNGEWFHRSADVAKWIKRKCPL